MNMKCLYVQAAKVWHLYVGAMGERTEAYKDWLCSKLRGRGHKHILDVACGTGYTQYKFLYPLIG